MPAMATVLMLLLAACGGSSDDQTVALEKKAPAASSAADGSSNEGADDAPDGTATGDDDSASPTAPPGDPGADAPGTDDPNGDLGDGSDDDGDDDQAKATVPAAALLDAETVGSVAGGTWTLQDAESTKGGTRCVAPQPSGAVASRTSVLTSPADGSDPASRLVETVSTHRGRAAAVTAANALATRLARCPGAQSTDQRVGDASVQVQLSDAAGVTRLVTVVAVEGVTIVLSGSGRVTPTDVWAALTDIALGSTCEAATDGCH
jgi:hypothetical protein